MILINSSLNTLASAVYQNSDQQPHQHILYGTHIPWDDIPCNSVVSFRITCIFTAHICFPSYLPNHFSRDPVISDKLVDSKHVFRSSVIAVRDHLVLAEDESAIFSKFIAQPFSISNTLFRRSVG